LKWAETANELIAADGSERLLISNAYTNRLVHRWRSEEAGIMVGTQTALKDNPTLTNRLWKGNNPIRLVIDRNLRIPGTYQLFNDDASTIVFNEIKEGEDKHIVYALINFQQPLLEQIMDYCYHYPIQSIIVEGEQHCYSLLLMQVFGMKQGLSVMKR